MGESISPALPPPSFDPASFEVAEKRQDGSYQVGGQVFTRDQIEVNSDGTVTIDGKRYRQADFVISNGDQPQLDPPGREANGVNRGTGSRQSQESGDTRNSERQVNPMFNSNGLAHVQTMMMEVRADMSQDRELFADMAVEQNEVTMGMAKDIGENIEDTAQQKATRHIMDGVTGAVQVGAGVSTTRGLKPQRDASGQMREPSEAQVQRARARSDVAQGAGKAATSAGTAMTEVEIGELEAEKTVNESRQRISEQTANSINEAAKDNSEAINQIMRDWDAIKDSNTRGQIFRG
ncbi:MAG: hypothetical protein WB791_04900 [Waddliaceae bacterium]